MHLLPCRASAGLVCMYYVLDYLDYVFGSSLEPLRPSRNGDVLSCQAAQAQGSLANICTCPLLSPSGVVQVQVV